MIHPIRKGVGYLAALAALATAASATAGGSISVEPITHPTGPNTEAKFALNYESEDNATVSGCWFKIYYKGAQATLTAVDDDNASTDFELGAELDADGTAPTGFTKYRIVQMDTLTALTDNDGDKPDYQYTLAELTFQTKSPWDGAIDISVQPIQDEHPTGTDKPIYSINIDANTGVANDDITYSFDEPAYTLPHITSVTPEGTYADAGDINITVNGTQFYNISPTPDSALSYDTTDLETTFQSANELKGVIPGLNLGAANAPHYITVSNGPGHGTSAPFPFYVVDRDEVYVDDDWADDGYQPGDIVDGKTDRIFGANAFAKIQDAVEAVNPGKTVIVHNGTYTESDILIAKPMTIDGESRDGVLVQPAIVDGHENGPAMIFSPDSHSAFIIASSGVTIQDLEIDGSANDLLGDYHYRAAVATNTATGTRSDIILKNLDIANCWRLGVYINGESTDTSTGNVIEDCTFTNIDAADVAQAILLYQADATVSGNTITNCGFGIATNYKTTPDAAGVLTFADNDIVDTPVAMNLSGLAAGSTIGGSEDAENRIAVPDGGLGAFIQWAAGQVTFSHNIVEASGSATGLVIYRPTNGTDKVIAANNTFTATDSENTGLSEGTGIFQFADGSFVTESGFHASEADIYGNTISGFAKGIHLYNSGALADEKVVANIGNTASNHIHDCDTGILVDGKYTEANIKNNDATISGASIGIDVAAGTATIDDNTITNNGTAIRVRDGGIADVTNNTLEDNAIHFAFEAGADDDSNVNLADSENRSVLDLRDLINDQTLVTGKTYVALGQERSLAGTLEREGDNYIRLRSTIQGSINAATPGNTVQAMADVSEYVEDLDITKALLVRGEGAAVTTIAAPTPSANENCVFLDADNITFEGFKVTRHGGVNTGSQNQGISIMQNRTNIIVQDNYVEKFFNGVYFNNTRGHIVRRNVLTDNRLGIQMVNNCRDNLIEQNHITGNWLIGILFNFDDPANKTDGPITVVNNNISGNGYSQINCSWINSSQILDVSGNYLGEAVSVDALAYNDGTYQGGVNPPPAAVVPVSTISGAGSAKVDFNAWLESEEDTSTAMGFQGDFRHLHLSNRSPIAATHGSWIQDGVDLLELYATPAGTNKLEMHDTGVAYLEAGAFVDTPCTIFGQGDRAVTLNPPTSDLNTGVAITVASSNVTVENLTIAGTDLTERYASAILRPNGGLTYDNTKLKNLTITYAGGDPLGAIELGQADILPLSTGNLVENCDLTYCNFAGLMIWAGDTEVLNNRFTNMTYTGLYVRPSTPVGGVSPLITAKQNTFTNASIGARLLAIDPASVFGATQGTAPNLVPDDTLANTFNLGAPNWETGIGRMASLGVSVEWGPCSITGNKFVSDNSVTPGVGGNVGVYVWDTETNAIISSNAFNPAAPNAAAAATAIVAVGQRNFPLGEGEDADDYTRVSIQGNTINNYGTGVLLGFATNGEQNVEATIGGTASNHIHGCATGILVSGSNASAIINNNAATIDGQNLAGTIGVDVASGNATLTGNTISNNEIGIRVKDGGTITANTNTLDGNEKHLAFEVTASGNATANTHNMFNKSAADLEAVANANTIHGRTYITANKVLSDNLVPETINGEDYTHLRSTIQSSVDEPVALNNTVNAMAGTFVENITVAKALRINGAGDGRLAGPITLVYPAYADLPGMNGNRPFGGSQLIAVEAGGVEVSNLKLDGDNPEVAGAGTIDAQNGISVKQVSPRVNNLHIHGCTIENMYLCGINADDVQANPSAYHIYNNIINNANSTANSSAIYAHFGRGIIENNTIANGRLYTLYCGGSLQGNTISNGSIITRNNDANLAILNNSVDDSPLGILVYSMENATLVTGNELTNVATGIHVEGSLGLITVDQNNVSAGTKAGAGSVSLLVRDLNLVSVPYTEGALVTANNNIFSGAEIGIKLENQTDKTIVADGTGNSIAGGLACVNTGDTQFNFSGNYWNLEGELATAAEVAELITGSTNVDFTPWLVSNHDDDTGDTGFTGDYSVLHVASSTNSDQVGAGRLQEAIDLIADGNAASGADRLIRVYEGTYAESNTVVNESVQITGINEAAVKVVPAAADGNVDDYITNAQHGFIVQANDVKINTLTIDGNGNTEFPGNNFRTAVIVDAATGDFSNTQLLDITANNLYRSAFKFGTSANRVDAGSVTSCIIENVTTYYAIGTVHGDLDVIGNTITNARGVFAHGPVAASAPLMDIRGNTITHPTNTLMNLVRVAANSNVGGSLLADRNTFNTNNGAAGKSIGLIIQYTDVPVKVENNKFNSDYSDVGIKLYHNEAAASPVNLINNEFQATNRSRAADAEGAAIVLTDNGDYFGDEDGDSYATITGSNIDGYAVGVELLRTGNSAPIGGRNVVATIGGASTDDNNTIANCVTGILVNEPDGPANGGRKAVAVINNNTATISNGSVGVDVSGGDATISNNAIAGNTIGIQVRDNGIADIDGNHIYGNEAGIKVSSDGIADIDDSNFAAVAPADLNTDDITISTDAGTVTIGDTTPNKFHASGQYIINTSSQNIDVRNNRFNVADPAGLEVTDAAQRQQLWDIENKLTHKINNDAYGFLRVKDKEVFVTSGKKGDSPTGVGAIERGVNAVVDADETVNVETGTYFEGLDINKFVEIYSADGDHLAVINNSGNSAGISVVIPSGAGAVKLTGLKITGTMDKGAVINGLNQTASVGSFQVKDCLFQQLANTGEALRIERAKLGTVENTYVVNCGKGIVINNSQNITVEDSWILENYATAIEVTKRENSGSGVMAENVTINNVFIMDNGMDADPRMFGEHKEAYGIFVGTYAASGDPESAGILGKNTRITNCHIINNAGTGIWVAGQNMDISGIVPAPNATDKTIIQGNIIDGNGKYTGGNIPPHTESDKANTDGLKIRTSANTEVKYNVIRNNVRNGILVAAKEAHTVGCPGTVISANQIYDNVDQKHTVHGIVGSSLMTQIYGATDQEVLAQGNWWGHVYGPDHADNPQAITRGGKIIEQGGDVNYANWYGYRAPGQMAYALNDRDGDGIPDALEDMSPRNIDPGTGANRGTNLNGNATLDGQTTETLRHLADTDDDGVDDNVEIKLGFDPLDNTSFPVEFPWAVAADGDADNDGYRDSYEYAVGSDPEDAESIPNLGNVNNNDNTRPNIGDVSLFRSVLVGNITFAHLPVPTANFTVYQDHMDINRDGVITNADVIGLRRFVELDPLVNIIPTK